MTSTNIPLNVMVIVEKETFKIHGERIDRWLPEISMLPEIEMLYIFSKEM